MPTANRLDKETNRHLDGGFMNDYREEVDVDRRLMLFYQHHNNCNDRYQNAVAIRRLVEEQNTRALLEKYKETSRKDNVSLAQDKTSKAKVGVKSEQQQSTSDPSRSQKDCTGDSNKEPSSLAIDHNRESIVEIDSGGTRPASRNNYSVVTSGAMVKQEEGVLLSSSCPHQTADAIGKSSLNMSQHQQPIVGLCDNSNSSSYSEAKAPSVSGSRKSSISNITNGFVGLPGKPDDELNLNAESFISENATISFLPSVDADNSDPVPLKKPPSDTSSKQSLQRTPLASNRSEDLSLHENDVEKGMDEFTKVMNQVIKREEGVTHQMRRNSSSNSLSQLPSLPQLPTTTAATGSSTNGSSSSPPPYPGTPSLTSSTIKQAAQQLVTAKKQYQHMVANMDHVPNVSQPPTPMAAAVESNWQQQQIMAAKQQQMLLQQQQQQQQQHYHNTHQAKPASIQRKPQPQPQQQQYEFMKTASPNVTIVSRDPYHSAAAMNMIQQQSQHNMLHQAITMNQHQPMVHVNTAPVQTMGQPTQMPQQSMATMSRNQPQIYAPLPNVDAYMGPGVEQQHAAALTTRSGSLSYGGPIDGHIYQRRHSMPPQLPTQQQQAQWPPGGAMQHQDLIFESFYSPGMDPHQQQAIAGQKRSHPYIQPQVPVAKRNSLQHSSVLSHTISAAAFQHQQHNPLVNGELNQAFHNPINDPLIHYDNRNDLFNTPL